MDPTQIQTTQLTLGNNFTQQQLIATQVQQSIPQQREINYDEEEAEEDDEEIEEQKDKQHEEEEEAEEEEEEEEYKGAEEEEEEEVVEEKKSGNFMDELDEEEEEEYKEAEEEEDEEEESNEQKNETNAEEEEEEGKEEDEDESTKKKLKKKSEKKKKEKKSKSKETDSETPKKEKSKKRKNRTADEEEENAASGSSDLVGVITDQEDSTLTYKPQQKELDEFDKIVASIKPKTKYTSAELEQQANAANQIAEDLVSRMELAYVKDEESMDQKKPALEKLKLLPEVVEKSNKKFIQQPLLDKGFFKQLYNWIKPLPNNKGLPNLNIRSTVLDILVAFPVRNNREDNEEDVDITQEGVSVDNLKTSLIGRAVKILSLHPNETPENKRKASAIIEKWSRYLFKTERETAPPEQELMQARKKRKSTSDNIELEQRTLNPGDPGFIYRARVPKKEGFDFVVNAPGKKLDNLQNVQKIPNAELYKVLHAKKKK